MKFDVLLLKWGTIKDWNFSDNKIAMDLIRRYIALGSNLSAMAQRDTIEQKFIICDVIRAMNGSIYDDWTGKKLTKDEAIKYIFDYEKRFKK